MKELVIQNHQLLNQSCFNTNDAANIELQIGGPVTNIKITNMVIFIDLILLLKLLKDLVPLEFLILIKVKLQVLLLLQEDLNIIHVQLLGQ